MLSGTRPGTRDCRSTGTGLGPADTETDSYSGNTIMLNDSALARLIAPPNSLIAASVNKYMLQADDIGTSEDI